MPISPRLRWKGLLLALAATLAATFAPDDMPPDSERPSPQARRAPRGGDAAASAVAPARSAVGDSSATASPSATDAAATVAAHAGNATAGDEAGAPLDAFRPKSWQPPPPPPPKPVAPPLPFKYLGKVVDEGEPRFFVARQDKYLTLREGDSVDAQYLFERAERGRLVFLYRPLQQRQFLAIVAD